MTTLSNEVSALEVAETSPQPGSIRGDSSEAGQTSTEYTAMTAVALLTAILLTWGLLGGALGNALSSMTAKFMDFLNNPPTF